MIGRETNFKTDKYNKPVYLTKRDSIAQVINNGLFMKPGNCPSHPERGVDIEQYLGKPIDYLNESKITYDLKKTCGDELIGSDINRVTCQFIKDGKKEYVLILISLTIDGTEDSLAMIIQKEKDNIVHFQYSFINEDVPI